MGPWLSLLNVYATAILHIFISLKIMRLEGLKEKLLNFKIFNPRNF